MADFEYLQNIPFGQYLAVRSPLRRLDARIRILVFMLLLIAVTFAPRLGGLLTALGVMLVVVILERIPLRLVLKSLLAPLPFLLIIAVLQLLFFKAGTEVVVLFSIGKWSLTAGAVESAVGLLVRFMTMILVIQAASACVSTSEGNQGTARLLRPLTRLGFPAHILVMVIQVTLHFFPLLAVSAENIARAQASRGAAIGRGSGNLIRRARQTLPLIVPLFIISLKRAENLALAMEARAYGVFKERTSLAEFKLHWYDWIVLVLIAGLCVLIFLV